MRPSFRTPRRQGAASGGLDELPLALDLERALALDLVAPVLAVFRFDPAAQAGCVATRPSLRDDALKLVLADGGPQSRAVVERLGVPRALVVGTGSFYRCPRALDNCGVL
jgi:hypothetical protein